MVTYNQQAWVAEALESALRQDLEDIEVVVGDDGSTDRTMEIVEGFAAKDGRVRVLPTPEKLGQRRNYMRTLAACRGRYVNQLDGDDFFLASHKLRIQADFMDAHPALAGCFTTAHEVDLEGRLLGEPFRPVGQRPIYTLSDFATMNHSHSSAMMFRRGLFSEYPTWFVDAPVGDWTLHVLNAVHGDFAWIDETLAAHRLHPDGIWTRLTERERLKQTLRGHTLFLTHLDEDARQAIRRPIIAYLVALEYHHEVTGNHEQAADILDWLSRHASSDVGGARLLRIRARHRLRQHRIGRAFLLAKNKIVERVSRSAQV